jgi:hypothetical protein
VHRDPPFSRQITAAGDLQSVPRIATRPSPRASIRKGWIEMINRTKGLLLGAAAIAACTIGCNNSSSGSAGTASSAAASASAAPAAASASVAASASAAPSASAASLAPTAPVATGHLTYKVLPTKIQELQLLQTMMDSKEYPGGALVQGLDQAFAFPNDVTELVRDCGTINAFYEPSTHTVNLCYELIGFFYGVFAKAKIPGQTPTQGAMAATLFTQLHETGHALIKELNIGAMGNEETDVDGFATVFLLKLGANGVARDGAIAMYSMLGLTGPKPDYFNEHPPSQERVAEILCLVYGSDPSANADLIAKHLVEAERAPKCAAEFQNTSKVWKELLDPHLKAKAN